MQQIAAPQFTLNGFTVRETPESSIGGLCRLHHRFNPGKGKIG
jgi:hypothetical protein